jgi:hypothetical protein
VCPKGLNPALAIGKIKTMMMRTPSARDFLNWFNETPARGG